MDSRVWRATKAIGIAIVVALAGAMMLEPVARAATGQAETRVMSERPVDRARAENLQRWVVAGHAEWCKDARLVAAEEMWRLAPDFTDGGLELNAVDELTAASADGARVMTFEWVPRDGRAVYRVTVERFAWLLPIANDAESIIWVPTRAETVVYE